MRDMVGVMIYISFYDLNGKHRGDTHSPAVPRIDERITITEHKLQNISGVRGIVKDVTWISNDPRNPPSVRIELYVEE